MTIRALQSVLLIPAIALLSLFAIGQQSPSKPAARHIGAIKAISGNEITLATDSGTNEQLVIAPDARVLRIAPGEKNLKNATPAQVSDLSVGDRILVAGHPSDDGNSIIATTVVLMKQSDVESRNKEELEKWQKGVGGVVKSVDPATHTITLSAGGLGRSHPIAIHVADATIIRRYAPGSTRFEDAKPSTLQEIEPGDQLRARGTRSADGTELTADEIVSGHFSNIAGTVVATDPAAGTISIKDLLSKKDVVVKVTPESQLHSLPPEFAQRLAARIKTASAPASGETSAKANPQAAGASQNHEFAGGNHGGPGGAGRPDFEQMLSRMPLTSIPDLHKGDAVLVVATQGTTSQTETVITLVSGVEPILEAAPKGSQAMMLTPWSLGGGGGEGDNP